MRIVVVADMHVGHVRALTPKEYMTSALTNDFQRWIIEQWEDFTKRFNSPDYLILNGDLADGSQVKSLGIEAITTDLDEQEKMCVHLLKPLIGKKTKIFGINGSGYHGGMGQGTCMDKRITEAVGGTFEGNNKEFKIGQIKFQFAHGSGGGVVSPDAYIRRELSLVQKNSNKRHTECPNILVRSHGHLYLVVGDAVATIYMTPCWQYPTPFMEQKTANVTPDIGALIIDIDDYPKVYPIIYPIPEEVFESMKHYEEIKLIEEEKEKEKKKEEEKIRKVENLRILKETLKIQNKK